MYLRILLERRFKLVKLALIVLSTTVDKEKIVNVFNDVCNKNLCEIHVVAKEENKEIKELFKLFKYSNGVKYIKIKQFKDIYTKVSKNYYDMVIFVLNRNYLNNLIDNLFSKISSFRRPILFII